MFSYRSDTLTDLARWRFLTNHARALLYIAHDPRARLRDLAAALDITERTAYGVVADLTSAGYVVKEKVGCRNCYGSKRIFRPCDTRSATGAETAW